MLTKLVTAAMLGAIADDRERHRYSLVHNILRSDGLGDWVKGLDQALIGPASQHLLDAAKEDRRSLTELFGPDTWQNETVHQLFQVLRAIAPDVEEPATRSALRAWFAGFSVLRNKTRGHGALTPASCARLCPPLEQTIRTLTENLPVLQRPWAYLHRNLSGKFRVVPLGGDVLASNI
jgi:hypothetical protein